MLVMVDMLEYLNTAFDDVLRRTHNAFLVFLFSSVYEVGFLWVFLVC